MLDSRLNFNALLTASIDKYIPGMKGATLANYVECRDLVKNLEGQVEGAVLFDSLKKKEFKVKAKVVVNCTGIHADELRLKDDAQA
jgi:glycerol-3-phosphate dehydrogenase